MWAHVTRARIDEPAPHLEDRRNLGSENFNMCVGDPTPLCPVDGGTFDAPD
jgi:hypothetical protein